MSEQLAEIKSILKNVHDPEIPVLSVMDMGVVQDIQAKEDGSYLIQIIPTYSGCPAMDTIADDIRAELKENGIEAEVKQVITPAWTTDMITEEGRQALEKYGIAAPLDASADKAALDGEKNQVQCTNCGSKNTKMVSRFGSTACKALFQCNDCHEPFDYFKCLR
jgi:ring-1,2-phenylacetyl-CoA epoxidase subunit PaaD